MSLQLILGPANSAKAGVVLDAYRAAARRDALLVVPSSADAAYYDRELTEPVQSSHIPADPGPRTALGRTLTFPRLIETIAARAGDERRKLTPLQRRLLIERARARQTFTAITEAAASQGFPAAAERLISELRGAHIDPPRFTAALRDAELGEQLEDLAALYRTYAREVERSGRVDEEQYFWGALDALRAQPARWGPTPIFFYGFDDLSAVQLDAIRTLAGPAAADVTVSLTFEQDREALRGRAEVAAELREIATEVTVLPALDDYYAPPSRRALHHLERHLFEPAALPADPGAAVRLIEAGGALAEAEQVAADVLSALWEGVPGEEIAVIARSLATSGQLLERTLTRYGVAVHSNRPVAVAHTRLGRAVIAWLRLTDDPQAPAAELIAFLRAASTGDPEPIDRFEAVVRRAGISTAGDALAQPAGRALGRHELATTARLLPGQPDSIPLTALVYQLLGRLGPGDPSSARAAAAILEALTELDELDLPTPASRAELQVLLEPLEVAPGSTALRGAVLVAEPAQIRARRFRRVFITGLCDGEFPGALTNADPFLDSTQRFELGQSAGLRLPRLEEPLQRERYLLYACLSRATEQVTFSFRTSDEEGKRELPSPFLDDVRALFTGVLWERRERRALADVAWTPRAAPTERERQLALAVIDGDGALAAGAPQTRALSPDALAHVRHASVVSAGALVTFARCPVRWLVENQLRPEGLDPDGDPLAQGTFMHTVLERTLSTLEAPVTDANVDDAVALMRGFAAADHELAPGQSPQVRDAVRDGAVAILERFLRATASPSDRWQPAFFETRFGVAADGLPPLELAHAGEQIRVSGTIDRIDRDRMDPTRALVHDYKSGGSGSESRPGARWVQDGEIQVALYMLAAQRLLGLTPVAGLYQPLKGEKLSPRGTLAQPIDGLGAVKTDIVDGETLATRLQEAEALAVELGGRIARGELTPCPERCSGDGCRYPWICWAQ